MPDWQVLLIQAVLDASQQASSDYQMPKETDLFSTFMTSQALSKILHFGRNTIMYYIASNT